MNRSVRILDCTIRDGSYVVDYQFTVEDTMIVAGALAASGIGHIEVGHGVGLNAQNCGKGHAAISDVEYIQAARAGLPRDAKIGSFFIPGIGTEDTLKAAAEAGLGFIRVGIDIDDYKKLASYIRLGRTLGLEVWANMMKSYLVPPARFAEIAKALHEEGADIVALVDSAGGMTPDDVAAYTSAAIEKTSGPLAFHGHNNLTLAVANCLRFVQCGGTFVDGTLSGMGRSGGNAATELLAALLAPRLAEPVDWKRLIELADALMEFCVPDHSHPRAAEIATGLNYFHSSFRDRIVEPAASSARASLFRTILQLPAFSRKVVTAEIAQAAAEAAATESAPALLRIPEARVDALQRQQPTTLDDLANRFSVLKGKSPLRRVVTIAQVAEVGIRVRGLRRGSSSLVAHVEVGAAAELPKLRDALTDPGIFWVVDSSLASASADASVAPVLVYEDGAVVLRAIMDTLQLLSKPRAVVATVGMSDVLRSDIERRYTMKSDGSADVLITCDPAVPGEVTHVRHLAANGVVLLVRPGTLTPAAMTLARQLKLRMWRLDCGPALVTEAERLVATYERFHKAAGVENISDRIRVVSGGVVGCDGDVVVDDCAHPRFILGIADGQGGLRGVSDADVARVREVQQWIVGCWGI